jgi:UDP-N-acetyl-D-glucosamine dehydrogenase
MKEKDYFVHESSYIDEPCAIGSGTKIWHFSHIMSNCSIGCNCNIGQNVVISPNVTVGDRIKIQNNVSIYSGVICEDDVFLGPSCVFTNVINPRSFIDRKDEYKTTLIKKGASIGANATILCGNTIGRYAFIGAGAVVTKDVPDYALMAGNPARIIGYICQCGTRLDFDLSGHAQCASCGIRYHNDNGIVSEELQPSLKEILLKKINNREITVAVVGLGYVGLPLAVEKAKAGYKTIGFDIQAHKVAMVNRGINYIGDVVDNELKELVEKGMLSATSDFSFIKNADFIAIAVPTPLDEYQQPDISYVRDSTMAVAQYLRKGSMVVLESTTYPGTTEELMLPLLEQGSGLKCGEDFFLAFSPERVDPGNLIHQTKNTPKVVGGVGKDATEVIAAMYRNVLQADVFEASSPRIAEMGKILENTYRNVNIGLVNELAMLCHKMNINIWEVIEAAKTKPFGFTPFYPGPGLGGHCIPLDPYYLSWKAREYGFHTSMIESSMMINDRMPEYIVERTGQILNRFKKTLNGAQVLILGVAYKGDIDDYRESPAIRVIEQFEKAGAQVEYYDPYIKEYNHKGSHKKGLDELSVDIIQKADIVVITTNHSRGVDYQLVQAHAPYIFDTKNAMKDVKSRDNIALL